MYEEINEIIPEYSFDSKADDSLPLKRHISYMWRMNDVIIMRFAPDPNSCLYIDFSVITANIKHFKINVIWQCPWYKLQIYI
jgi:hypothetical protein